jgi:hypothetical protein
VGCAIAVLSAVDEVYAVRKGGVEGALESGGRDGVM